MNDGRGRERDVRARFSSFSSFPFFFLFFFLPVFVFSLSLSLSFFLVSLVREPATRLGMKTSNGKKKSRSASVTDRDEKCEARKVERSIRPENWFFVLLAQLAEHPLNMSFQETAWLAQW